MTNAATFPHLPAEMIAQMDDYDARIASGEIQWDENGHDHGHKNGQTHPEIWMPGNALDYFLSTGGIAPVSAPKPRPYVGGWASITEGRWQSGGPGAYSAHRRVVS